MSQLIFIFFFSILSKAVADVERAIVKALEKQYNDILTPLKDSIPKRLNMHVQKLTRRQSTTLYSVPNQVSGANMNIPHTNTDVLHSIVSIYNSPIFSCGSWEFFWIQSRESLMSYIVEWRTFLSPGLPIYLSWEIKSQFAGSRWMELLFCWEQNTKITCRQQWRSSLTM